MLTKQLKFDEDVLAVIRGMEFTPDGLLGKITGGQLERVLYTKVNKALDAMGGKWNKKFGGHVFTFDPRPQVDGLIANGTLTVERDGFFETPVEVVDLMFSYVTPKGKVLEPSAGMGSIAKHIREYFTDIIFCVEKNQQRVNHLQSLGFNALCADFLTVSGQKYDTIIMNPPFEEGQDMRHVQHAYALLTDYGSMVSVMGAHAFFADDKQSIAFRDWLGEVNAQIVDLPEGSFKSSGTMVNTKLVIITKEQ